MAEEQLSSDERRDITINALLNHHEQTARQIAEIARTQGEMSARLAAGDARMGKIEVELRDNTAVTTEVRDILSTFKGGMRVLGYLGTAARWVGYIATAVVAIYTAVYALTHNGELPHR